MDYDYLVFIGRFQPFHNGHKRVVDKALSYASQVILLIGSNNVARSSRNPWTFSERADMITSVYPQEVGSGRLILRPLDDHTYSDNKWVEQTQSIVKDVLVSMAGNSKHVTLHGLNDAKIGLIGCNKDHSSYYLKLFPKWGDESVDFLNPINATDIREDYFNADMPYSWAAYPVHNRVCEYLVQWRETPEYTAIQDETRFIMRYKRQWGKAPYPPTFVTVDALVVQSGHLLVVRRGAQPGKGQIALPGGFIGENELIEDAAIRELREETRVKVPEPVLRGSITSQKVFDDPNRSSRGRTITHAYLFSLTDRPYLPEVKGDDDAADAFWMPLSEVKSSPKKFYEDHWFIIQNMIN